MSKDEQDVINFEEFRREAVTNNKIWRCEL